MAELSRQSNVTRYVIDSGQRLHLHGEDAVTLCGRPVGRGWVGKSADCWTQAVSQRCMICLGRLLDDCRRAGGPVDLAP